MERLRKVLATSAAILLFGPSACGDSASPGGAGIDPVDGQGDGGPGLDAMGDATPVEGEDGGGDVVPADADAEVSPGPLPFDPVVEASLQAVLDEHVIFSADPGATLAVIADDGYEWHGASGSSEMQTGTPMEPHFGFRVGSNTKPFLSAALLQLVDEGLVGLDDPLGDYLDGYPMWAAITIRQLLGMKSGIPDFLTQTDLMLDFIVDPMAPREPEEVLAYVTDDPLLFEPGEGGVYSNTNYVLLGLVMEAVTGNTVAEELQTRLTEPLGLDDTFLDMDGEVRDTLAHGYMDLALVGQVFGVPPAVIAFIPEENRYEGTIVDCGYLFHPTLSWASGALVASAPDMARFMKALLAEEVISADTLAEMQATDEVEILGAANHYGLGLETRTTPWGKAWGHGGLNFGYQASTYYFRQHGLTLSHMHNFLPEQSGMLQNEALTVLVGGVDAPLEACRPPEGFFEGGDGGPYVHLRFKGAVNPLNKPVTAGGITHTVAILGGDEKVPLYGGGAAAKVELQGGVNVRLAVDSIAPGDGDLRLVSLRLDPALLSSFDEDGTYTLDPATPFVAYLSVAEVDLNAASESERLCYTALGDPSRPSQLNICDVASFRPSAGDMLKIFGAVAIETDLDTIAETLGMLGIPRCVCVTEAGEWGACPP